MRSGIYTYCEVITIICDWDSTNGQVSPDDLSILKMVGPRYSVVMTCAHPHNSQNELSSFLCEDPFVVFICPILLKLTQY